MWKSGAVTNGTGAAAEIVEGEANGTGAAAAEVVEGEANEEAEREEEEEEVSRGEDPVNFLI